MSSDKPSQLLICEAIHKITSGRSIEHTNLVPGGMFGIGTTYIIHGYVAKTHDNPSDEESSDYDGTTDVSEHPDETASAEPVIHKGALLSVTTNSEGGFLIVPVLLPDMTIFMNAATRYAYVVNLSHVDIPRLNARMETVIDMTEMEEPNPENDSSPNYDELKTTGSETPTHYTSTAVTTTVRSGRDEEAITVIDAENITHTVDKSEVRQTVDKVVQKVSSTTITAVDNKVTLGDENATESLVLDNGLTWLMFGFLTGCSKIVTPTLVGMTSPINMPNFILLTSRIRKFLSKTSYTK